MSDEDNDFIQHLAALRNTLLRCLYSLLIFFPVGFYFAPQVTDLLIKHSFAAHNVRLNFFSPAEAFTVQMKIGFIIGFVLAFPYITRKIWQFVLPALYDHEKNFLKKTVILSVLLFFAGVAFCIYFILPLVVNFGLSFATESIQPVLGLEKFISLTLWIVLAFGLMFQMPIIVAALIKSDLISVKDLKNKRPYVFIGILIIAAILTPPDIVSQLLLAVPTYLLFELGILFAGKRL